MSDVNPFDLDRIEAVASRLDLRQPNREALESIVFEIAQHYEIEHRTVPFEAVVDVATGVGKTYIMAAAVEYLVSDNVSDFAVVTPGRTILNKTAANFTPGHPKSLLAGMEVRPVVVTSENFATAAMRAAMDDPAQVKLYIFTVQALLRPESSLVGRRTHKFQEGLGKAFYEHLQGLERLVVFADEHHTYYGSAFSRAIRDLHPWALIGLTATPHRQTPEDEIIYRYPLAAAIADKLVKTPVIVGRKDDRADMETKLLDGVRLLELKERAINRLAGERGVIAVSPMMLVVAPTIAEADEIAAVTESPSFASGRYAGRVLTVHSDAPDEALAQLARLEDPDSPYRIVISVGMLKEGWDVKNVYVIASMRASVSDLLTEQTLGRGMRLPFGSYTGIEILDTLEVLGHERYEDLLRKAGVLNEQFIDRRTRSVLRQNAEGQTVAVRETTETELRVLVADGRLGGQAVGAVIESVEDHTSAAAAEVDAPQVHLTPRADVVPLKVPRLRMTPVRSDFSIADITDLLPFRRLGESLATDPASELRRVTLSARIVEGPDGLRRTEIVRTTAVDRVESPLIPLGADELRTQLVDRVLGASVVPARAFEREAVQPLIDEFLRGLGSHASELLTSYLDRAAARLIGLVTDEARKFAAKPSFDEVVEVVEFGPTRSGRTTTTQDRLGPFKKGVGYEGYRKSIYAQDWFDSSPERTVANILDDAPAVAHWLRLQTGDLPILWSSAGRDYNPDLVVVETDGTHWLVEVKMDKEMTSAEVQAKRNAAQRWANHVNADQAAGARWRYLLVAERDIADAKESWSALKSLGS